MSDSERPDQELDKCETTDVNAGSGALIPMMPEAQPARPIVPPSRPSPVFVTHLLATVEQVPQTRTLRRATPAEAQTAYKTQKPERRRVSRRTRQVI